MGIINETGAAAARRIDAEDQMHEFAPVDPM